MILQILFEPGRAIGDALNQLGQAIPSVFNQKGLRRGQAIEAVKDPEVLAGISTNIRNQVTDAEGNIDEELFSQLIGETAEGLGIDATDAVFRERLGSMIRGPAFGAGPEEQATAALSGDIEFVGELAGATREDIQARRTERQRDKAVAEFEKAVNIGMLKGGIPEGIVAAEAAKNEFNAAEANQQLAAFAAMDILKRDNPLLAALGPSEDRQAILMTMQNMLELDLLALKGELDAAAAAGEALDPIKVSQFEAKVGFDNVKAINDAVDTGDKELVAATVQNANRQNQNARQLREQAGLDSLPFSTIYLNDGKKVRQARVEFPPEVEPNQYAAYESIMHEALSRGAADPVAYVQGLANWNQVPKATQDAMIAQLNAIANPPKGFFEQANELIVSPDARAAVAAGAAAGLAASTGLGSLIGPQGRERNTTQTGTTRPQIPGQ